jgi:hypothetical protein
LAFTFEYVFVEGYKVTCVNIAWNDCYYHNPTLGLMTKVGAWLGMWITKKMSWKSWALCKCEEMQWNWVLTLLNGFPC